MPAPASAPKTKPPMKKRPAIKHGGGTIEVPLLSGPVGRWSAAFSAKYPQFNLEADVAIVDYYLSQLEAIKYLDRGARAQAAAGALFPAVDAVAVWTDRNAAIATLQSRLGIRDADEVKNTFIKPDGETLIALVDYGDLAEKLLANHGVGTADYIYVHNFTATAFQAEFVREFSKDGRYDAAAIPALMNLVDMMTHDNAVIDIRWMAYMLATVFWETTYPKSESSPVLDKKGRPVVDKKGQPVMRTKKRWAMTMAPVDEIGHGAGRDYYLPVKVEKLPSGARITEQDGDQFLVTPSGAFTPATKGAKLGSNATAAATSAYDGAAGDELSYYGRGYVQLTWWSNYAKAGVVIGRGLDLLFNPELVKEPATAYSLMSRCMCTGAGFANGRRFSHYFCGTLTDYVNARAMVNGSDHRNEIAAIATRMEKILLYSKACTDFSR
jgi:hypothetical protein